VDTSKLKRIFSLIAAAVLILAFGCGKAVLNEKAAADAAVAVVSAIADEETDNDAEPNAAFSGAYNVDASTDETAGGSFVSSKPGENAILVQNAGVFTMENAAVEKSGDAEAAFSNGSNAAVSVLTQGQLTMTGSTVITGARGGFGLFVSGAGSQLAFSGGSVSTTGESSPALTVADGGIVSFAGGTLSTDGTDSPCVLLEGGGVTLKGVSLSASDGELLRVLSGANELTLDNTGIEAAPVIREGATLKLTLLNGSAFFGELGAEPPAKVSVTLDASSTLTLAADTYLVALVNADTTHQNIQSNGFSLYYDSNAPENAYLNNQSFALPGGGYLMPMI